MAMMTTLDDIMVLLHALSLQLAVHDYCEFAELLPPGTPAPELGSIDEFCQALSVGMASRQAKRAKEMADVKAWGEEFRASHGDGGTVTVGRRLAERQSG